MNTTKLTASELVAQYGISERTAYRWLANNDPRTCQAVSVARDVSPPPRATDPFLLVPDPNYTAGRLACMAESLVWLEKRGEIEKANELRKSIAELAMRPVVPTP